MLLSFARWIKPFLQVARPRLPSETHDRTVRLHLDQLEERSLPSSTYLVSSLADTNTPGTLRYEITQANADNTGTSASPDQIQFTVSGGTISVTGTPLPALTDVAVIDGATATSYSGIPVITLDGTSAGANANGLILSGGSTTVEGLDIVHFSGDGIQLDTNGGNTVVNNYIGIGTSNLAEANGGDGIFINGSSGNTIGGTGAMDANVISGNSGDGIRIDGLNSLDNVVVANFIGTNATGATAVGNAGNGVQISNGARLNTIGGNMPTATAFTGKPIDGNVISGNGANGVLLTNAAGFNTLSGNFIGTDLAGTLAVGNALDGVAILNGANNNSLIGTTFPQQPFVYLNLISGNDGNGLRIQNSNNTTVQANCFGLGDNNLTPVPNQLDGVLIEGTSTNTQFGGVIPLGNISAGNIKNGVEIAGTASGTVCFNTFCGLPAFVDTPVGNGADGFLITSTGGNNLLRTNVIAGNVGNGVHISGNAAGVQVAEDIIGMDTNGQSPLPNGGDGVLIDGNANNNIIGGTQISVITQNTISANGGDGVAIVGNAEDNQVIHSFIGANILGVTPFGNTGAGVFIGGHALDNTIGGLGAFDQDVISGNLGDGIELSNTSQGTQVIGDFIGTDRNGQLPLANQGSGIGIFSSSNQIGGTAAGAGNVIAYNIENGVAVDSGVSDSIIANSIFGNGAAGIFLVNNGNQNQPAPILGQAVQPSAGAVQITGILVAAASTTYFVELFASPTGSPGQGQTYLGSLNVTTDAGGLATFVAGTLLPINAGSYFTATATDPVNNTSAFSAPLKLGESGSNIVVSVNPVGQTAISGGTVRLTAAATGNPAPTVQWQISTDGGNSWNNLSDGGNYSGTTTVTLTVAGATVALNGDEYKAVFSNALGQSATSAAKLLVTSTYASAASSYAYSAYIFAFDAYVSGSGSYNTFYLAYYANEYAYNANDYNTLGNTADSEYDAAVAYNDGYWASYDAYTDYLHSSNMNSFNAYENDYYAWVYSYDTSVGY